MRRFLISLYALIAIGTAAAIADYTATQGAGTSFGSIIRVGVHYAQFMICDLNTPGQCASVSAGGAVKVDGSAVTQPVSLASTTITGNTTVVQPTGTQLHTVVDSGTITSITNPVSANATLSAETTKVIGTVRTLGNGGAITDFAGQNAASPPNAWLMGAQFQTTPTTISPGNASPLQLDNAGNLLVNIKAGGGAGGTSSTFGTTFPTAGAGTAAGFYDGTNMAPARVGAVANVAAATSMLQALGVCQYNATPLTVTDTRYQSAQCDVNGFLKVNVTNANTNGAKTSANSSPVVLATDEAAVAAWGHVATGAAPPTGATYVGANTSGATGGLVQGLIQCDSSQPYDASTNGSTELVPVTSGRRIHVCGYSIMAGGTVNVKLIRGTGTACVTGSANLTPSWQLTAQVGIVDGSPFARGLKTNVGDALCIFTSGAVAVQAIVYYAII